MYKSLGYDGQMHIGGGAIPLPGVEIGEGTTTGVGSVVTRSISIPVCCVAAGNFVG